MQPVMQWENQYPAELLTIDAYPLGTSSYELYEDDGTTMDYAKGIFARTLFQSELTPEAWTFTAAKPEGTFIPPAHTYLIKALLDSKPLTVTENGKTVDDWTYDEETHRLVVKTKGGNKENVTIKAQLL
jgi:hypothetical protein